MPLVYSAVARGPVILSEYAVFAGNFNQVAKDYLAKTHAGDGKFTYTVDSHVFSFLAHDGFTFVVVSDEQTGRTVPTAFLDKLKEEFSGKYTEKGRVAKEGELKSFGKRIKELMEQTTQFPEQFSKVASVQRKVDEVKSIMSENIEKVLERGEKLDLLVDKTDNLMFEADRFQKQGKALRRKMWCQNVKMKIVLFFVFVLIVLILFLLICFSGRNCLAKKRTSPPASPAHYY